MSQDTLGQVLYYVPIVVTAAAAAAATLPHGAPGSTWEQVRKVIDTLAMNFGNAKNAGPKA